MTTSYSNPGGSGDRRSIITITETLGIYGTITSTINGVMDYAWWAYHNVAGTEIKFDFGVGASKVIDEATWYETGAASSGIWQWQGGNDDVNWTDIGAQFTLNPSAPFVMTTLNGNTTGWRYYRMLGISGSFNAGPYVQEITFKIDDAATGSTRDLTTSCTAVSTSSDPLVTVIRSLSTSVAVVFTIPDFALWENATTPFPYDHPNTPANDPTCVSFWRFETGDSIRDYIGTNDLTGMPLDNPPGTTPTCKEGVSAQAFELANSQYLTRPDADLSADFPLKSTAGQIGNISCWFYANSLGGFDQTLVAKGDESSGLAVVVTQGVFRVYWMGAYVGGGSLTTGRWYHLSLNFDGPNKTVGFRIWDEIAQSVVALIENTFGDALTGNSSPFTVGGTVNFWDGAIDELIVWNRKLTIAEMELVQEQYFHGDVDVENNNFASDPYCQAVWDFEESAPTADTSGKGNNIVTDNLFASNGLVGAGDGGKSGNGYGQITGAYIPDANLVNGFPFKSNDTTKKATVCAWIAPFTIYGAWGGPIFSKRGIDNNGFEIIQDNSTYNLKIKWGDGSNLTTYDTGITLNQLHAYHISVEIDGINKTIYAEVFNNYTGVLYTYSVSPSTQATVSTQPLGIGANGVGDSCFYGYIDQVVVWNRLLDPAELAAVRAGTFVSRLLATDIVVQSQVPGINLIVQRDNLTTSAAVVSAVGTPVLKIERPLATIAAVVSNIPDVDLSIIILGAFTTICTVVSAISAPLLKITRPLSSAPAVATAIPNPLLAVLRNLQSSVEIESATSSPLLAVLRKLASTVGLVSTSSTPNLLVLRHLATLAAVMSATSNINLSRFRQNTAHITVQSQIPNVILDVIRPLNSSIVVQSQAPNITLRVWRDLVTAILVQSAASAPAIDTHNYLFTAIEVVTEGSGSVDILRLLATPIAVQVTIPDISLIQHAIWDLVTNIVVRTQTPDNVELTLTFYESLLAKAKRYYGPVDVSDLEAAALQWLPPEEERELHLPGDQFNDHEFQ